MLGQIILFPLNTIGVNGPAISQLKYSKSVPEPELVSGFRG